VLVLTVTLTIGHRIGTHPILPQDSDDTTMFLEGWHHFCTLTTCSEDHHC